MATEADVREIALALPETAERPSYGTPGFRVKDRLFARIREPGVLVLWVGDEGEKDFLIRADPEKFFTIPHCRRSRRCVRPTKQRDTRRSPPERHPGVPAVGL